MPCCIIATLIIAHCVELMRRWGVYLCLLPRREDDELATVATSGRALLMRWYSRLLHRYASP